MNSNLLINQVAYCVFWLAMGCFFPNLLRFSLKGIGMSLISLGISIVVMIISKRFYLKDLAIEAEEEKENFDNYN